MTLEQINAELVEIMGLIDNIDLSKEATPEQIKKMADKPIERVEKVSADKGFTEENLDTAINIFGQAKVKVEKYDPNEEYVEAQSDKTKSKDILVRVSAKKDAVGRIAGKYDELTRKKDVIEKYKKKFDIRHLEQREERKLLANNNRIANNEARWQEIQDFKGKIRMELEDINICLKEIKELEELEKQFKKLKEDKADIAKLKADPSVDKDVIADYEAKIINENESKCKEALEKATKKYPTLKANNLEGSIAKIKGEKRSKIAGAKGSIKKKLGFAEKKYGYKRGFQTFMDKRIQAIKTDEEFLSVFDSAQSELSAKNYTLQLENDKVNDNITSMREGQKIMQEGETGDSKEEPTEEEIQKMMESIPTSKALSLTGEELEDAVYKYLVEQKGKDPNKNHPILKWMSTWHGKQDEWRKSYEEKLRAEAIEKIRSEKQDKKAKVVESKREKFISSLLTRVMKADDKTVKQMDEAAEKNPGQVLEDIYKDMDDDSTR